MAVAGGRDRRRSETVTTVGGRGLAWAWDGWDIEASGRDGNVRDSGAAD